MNNFKDRLMKADHIWGQLLKNQSLIGSQLVAGAAAGDVAVSTILKGDDLVSVAKLASVQQVSVAGAVAGDITVTGIATTDRLISVINLTDGVDLTSEFTITAADTINNTGGTATDTDKVQVTYENPVEDLTSEFTITSDGIINNASGTVTTNFQLLVSFVQWQAR